MKYAAVDELEPGDRLGQDIIVGNVVLLRKGALLQAHEITHLRQLDCKYVVVARNGELPTVQVEVPPATIASQPSPDFDDLSPREPASWLDDAHFKEAVPAPAFGNEHEEYFLFHKEKLRDAAGLVPLLDPGKKKRIQADIHAAFVGAAMMRRINLDLLGDLADCLSAALEENPGGYIEFTDVRHYGEYLAAKTVMSSTVFSHAWPTVKDGELDEHVRGHLVLGSLFTILPPDVVLNGRALSCEEQKRGREALLRFYSWLRRENFVREHILELLILQFEQCQGGGLPYGIGGDMIPPQSEAWAVARTYASVLFSRPGEKRLTCQQAADRIISSADRAFSSKGVNRFLRSLGYFPNGSLVTLRDNRAALVVRQDDNSIFAPVVQVVDRDRGLGETICIRHQPSMFGLKQVAEH